MPLSQLNNSKSILKKPKLELDSSKLHLTLGENKVKTEQEASGDYGGNRDNGGDPQKVGNEMIKMEDLEKLGSIQNVKVGKKTMNDDFSEGSGDSVGMLKHLAGSSAPLSSHSTFAANLSIPTTTNTSSYTTSTHATKYLQEKNQFGREQAPGNSIPVPNKRNHPSLSSESHCAQTAKTTRDPAMSTNQQRPLTIEEVLQVEGLKQGIRDMKSWILEHEESQAQQRAVIRQRRQVEDQRRAEEDRVRMAENERRREEEKLEKEMDIKLMNIYHELDNRVVALKKLEQDFEHDNPPLPTSSPPSVVAANPTRHNDTVFIPLAGEASSRKRLALDRDLSGVIDESLVKSLASTMNRLYSGRFNSVEPPRDTPEDFDTSSAPMTVEEQEWEYLRLPPGEIYALNFHEMRKGGIVPDRLVFKHVPVRFTMLRHPNVFYYHTKDYNLPYLSGEFPALGRKVFLERHSVHQIACSECVIPVFRDVRAHIKHMWCHQRMHKALMDRRPNTAT